MRQVWTTVSAFFTINSRFTQWANSRIGSWRPIATLVLACLFLVVAVAQNQSTKRKGQPTREAPPYWAYIVEPSQDASDTQAKPANHAPQHVPGSSAAFTLTQIDDYFKAPDWHPAGHPAMPEVVAQGRKPDVIACGYCHLPDGQGRPELQSGGPVCGLHRPTNGRFQERCTQEFRTQADSDCHDDGRCSPCEREGDTGRG